VQKKFARNIDALVDIYQFAEDVFATGDVQDEVRFPVHLALEELYVNMVEYYPDNDNDILLEVAAADGKVTVTMTDFDVDPFDVTAPRNIDTDLPLGERVPGGLGLHLVQQMVDNLEYRYRDRQSTIKFTKESG
jgi:anti-sigma regulatory factor (Ser/Thr protein kinase)